MLLPSVFNSLVTLLEDRHVSEILKTNEESSNYGVVLTENDAMEIISTRSRALKNYGRIEIDIKATENLIQSFCSSPFINQENYVSSLNELQELFYYLKNETGDKIGDAKLISIMKNLFDEGCKGSLDLLKGKGVGEYLQEFKLKSLAEETILGGNGVKNV